MSTPTWVPSDLWEARATIEPGRRVAGRYLLLAPVGRGVSGSVWRAHDELLGRDVAIKQLHAGHALDASRARQVRDRAHREGRVAARLHHPRLAAIYDMSELDGEVCLVMEYVAAPSLADVLDREGPLPPRRVAAIGAQIAEGLCAMHARGIVHRDVKPANVMIGVDDVVTVTDFGIAVVDSESGASDRLVAGTPHYMAPEMARGGVATPAADLFSLGATLYATLEGTPPTGDGGNALEVLSRVAAGVVQPTRRAGDLTPVVRALLDHEPSRRPTAADAARMLADLGEAPVSGPGPAGPSRPEPQPERTVQPVPDDSHTGPVAVPAAVSAALAASRARTRVVHDARRTRHHDRALGRRSRPARRLVAVGAGLVGVLGAAGIVVTATSTSGPVPIAAPEPGSTPLAAPVPVAAPPVIPVAPAPGLDSTPADSESAADSGPTTSTPSRVPAVEDVASSSGSTQSAEKAESRESAEATDSTEAAEREASGAAAPRRPRDTEARAAEAWDRWFDRWRAQARAQDRAQDRDRDDDRPRERSRGRDR